ncbi:MAG: FAD binding domain-containing protein [Planctomycetota bacterium]
MRDHLVFYLNGQRRTAAGPEALATLTDYLRERRRLVGTKVVCAEGDCGACSVLVGRPADDGSATLAYHTIDACIAFMYQLDRAHVVTIEGLAEDSRLSAVQDAMVKCHGSQCGFCTPGFVVTMHGLLEDPGRADHVTSAVSGNGRANGSPVQPLPQLTEDKLRLGLSGNLCRCTGYQQILDAGAAIDSAAVVTMNQRFPARPVLDDFAALGDEPVRIETELRGVPRTVFLPQTLDQAAAFRAEFPGKQSAVASGTTDLGVQHTHGRHDPSAVLSLTSVSGLDRVAIEDGVLVTGATASWTRIERAVERVVPEYHAVLTRFGSPQIRNAGTIAGNLANASPIADSIPFHMVMDAELDLINPRGARVVKLNDFYLGYKQLDLAEDELIAAVRTPLPTAGQHLKLYKVSKRRDMDISTFTAAVLLTLDDAGETITAARLAFGGVAPVVLRLPETESLLAGQPFTKDTMRAAGQHARTEITPISDVRGGADYRLQLAENILVKCYHDLRPEPVPA